MNKIANLRADELRSILDYEPETGAITWVWRPREHFASDAIFKTWNSKYAGRPALASLNANGYLRGRVSGVPVLAHRIAFLVSYGRFPNGDIDHINGNRVDNRLENLREVSRSENMKNTKKPTRNTSGHIGISYDKRNRKWRARIHTNLKEVSLGRFDTINDAIAARMCAEKIYGFHPNHGRN